MADQPTTEALMADLHLNSLEIKNFRTFKHLEIERLGRVNLIVGKNGVGKTALLEALRLYAHKGDFPIIWDILSSRSENSRVPMQGRSATTESLIKAITDRSIVS